MKKTTRMEKYEKKTVATKPINLHGAIKHIADFP